MESSTQMALGVANLNLEMVARALNARCTKERNEFHRSRLEQLSRSLRKAIGYVLTCNTKEKDPHDLSKSDRDLYAELCTEAGILFGESGNPKVFLNEFTDFLERIAKSRSPQSFTYKPAA